MYSDESDYTPSSQDQLTRSFMNRSIGTAHHLQGINAVHSQLDPAHAVFSSEEAEVLKTAEEIMVRIRACAIEALNNVQNASRQGLGVDGGR